MRSPGSRPPAPTLELDGVSRVFGRHHALTDVSLVVDPGGVHAVLGPNGAGKTTLLRIVSGLTAPTSGTVTLRGPDGVGRRGWEARRLVGLVPAGERTFYFRLTGRENLRFFARLHALAPRAAQARAAAVLEQVGLSDAADRPVGLYSNGMKQRLAVARALLTEPSVLLVDEATHNLDPDGATRIRDLVRGAAGRGAVVVWATQRLDEIRGFADTVTVLRDSRVGFAGTVDELIARGRSQRYVVALRTGQRPAEAMGEQLQDILGAQGQIVELGGANYLLALGPHVSLGEALAALNAGCVDVVSCREERSELETAFLTLTRSAPVAVGEGAA